MKAILCLLNAAPDKIIATAQFNVLVKSSIQLFMLTMSRIQEISEECFKQVKTNANEHLVHTIQIVCFKVFKKESFKVTVSKIKALTEMQVQHTSRLSFH